MEHDGDPGLTVPVAFLLPLAAGGFLVGVRGVVAPEVVAVLLASSSCLVASSEGAPVERPPP